MTDHVNARRRAYVKGLKSEYLAGWVLRIKGYHIVAKRYKTSIGEIDIIARRGKLVVMVEVKARPTLEQAMDAVTGTALQRIEAAGDVWLASQPDYGNLSIRYDLIAVLPRRWPVHVQAIHTADAN